MSVAPDMPPRPDFLPPGFGTVGHRDFVEIWVPNSVDYTPQTTAWFVLCGLLLSALAWAVARGIAQRKKNAYRRAALTELERLKQQFKTDRTSSIAQLVLLLKRAALCAYSRKRVAALSGQAWIDFLESTAPGALSESAKRALLELSHLDVNELSNESDSELFLGVQRWLRGHRASV